MLDGKHANTDGALPTELFIRAITYMPVGQNVRDAAHIKTAELSKEDANKIFANNLKLANEIYAKLPIPFNEQAQFSLQNYLPVYQQLVQAMLNIKLTYSKKTLSENKLELSLNIDHSLYESLLKLKKGCSMAQICHELWHDLEKVYDRAKEIHGSFGSSEWQKLVDKVLKNPKLKEGCQACNRDYLAMPLLGVVTKMVLNPDKATDEKVLVLESKDQKSNSKDKIDSSVLVDSIQKMIEKFDKQLGKTDENFSNLEKSANFKRKKYSLTINKADGSKETKLLNEVIKEYFTHQLTKVPKQNNLVELAKLSSDIVKLSGLIFAVINIELSYLQKEKKPKSLRQNSLNKMMDALLSVSNDWSPQDFYLTIWRVLNEEYKITKTDHASTFETGIFSTKSTLQKQILKVLEDPDLKVYQIGYCLSAEKDYKTKKQL